MTVLTSVEAVPLGAAFALRFATDRGFRALWIKGDALAQQGLRAPHESVDVDVLVDPTTIEAYLAVLATLGWHPIAPGEGPRIAGAHAVTLGHDHWTITLDIHRHFPGFLAAPQRVFDLLWERRTSATSAGVQVPVPDPVVHAVLHGLHLLREPESGLALRIPDLAARIPDALGVNGPAEVAEVAAYTGATEVIAPLLEAIGAPRVPTPSVADPETVAAWRERTTAAPSSAWLKDLHQRPIREWPHAVKYAMWLTDAEIDTWYRQPRESRLRTRARRWSKGLRNLPGALAHVLRHSHPGGPQ